MTPLRQRMLEDMRVRNLARNTQLSYLQQVSAFARHFQKSPQELGPEEIRAYQVHLATVKKLAPSTCCLVAGALRFLFRVTLKKEWTVAEIPMPKKPLKLPGILSREEVTHFLKSIVSLKHRTILTTIYATGLRISEATHLQPTDIDSQRMMVRVRQGSRWVALLPWRMHWFMYCGVVFHSECASTPGRPWDRLSLHFGGLHLCQRLALARQSIHGLPAGLDQPGLKPLRYRR